MWDIFLCILTYQAILNGALGTLRLIEIHKIQEVIILRLIVHFGLLIYDCYTNTERVSCGRAALKAKRKVPLFSYRALRVTCGI